MSVQQRDRQYAPPLSVDEIPLFFKLLTDQMSSIDLRPGHPKPELDPSLSNAHHRKRHWMPAGLSGCAQVCALCTSSVKEAEPKLSYGLYDQIQWNVTLGPLSLCQAVKTLFKAKGA
ncbi:sugar transferase [Synechococcus sp. GFB01]|uniref:sugar transferase n=1 Tax=Synechococcus sp. GFB01 TaxID=1662190 RepID=UPI000907FC39|nr:sugar transferase [Synechococcus sp. GFB01]